MRSGRPNCPPGPPGRSLVWLAAAVLASAPLAARAEDAPAPPPPAPPASETAPASGRESNERIRDLGGVQRPVTEAPEQLDPRLADALRRTGELRAVEPRTPGSTPPPTRAPVRDPEQERKAERQRNWLADAVEEARRDQGGSAETPDEQVRETVEATPAAARLPLAELVRREERARDRETQERRERATEREAREEGPVADGQDAPTGQGSAAGAPAEDPSRIFKSEDELVALQRRLIFGSDSAAESRVPQEATSNRFIDEGIAVTARAAGREGAADIPWGETSTGRSAAPGAGWSALAASDLTRTSSRPGTVVAGVGISGGQERSSLPFPGDAASWRGSDPSLFGAGQTPLLVAPRQPEPVVQPQPQQLFAEDRDAKYFPQLGRF